MFGLETTHLIAIGVIVVVVVIYFYSQSQKKTEKFTPGDSGAQMGRNIQAVTAIVSLFLLKQELEKMDDSDPRKRELGMAYGKLFQAIQLKYSDRQLGEITRAFQANLPVLFKDMQLPMAPPSDAIRMFVIKAFPSQGVHHTIIHAGGKKTTKMVEKMEEMYPEETYPEMGQMYPEEM